MNVAGSACQINRKSAQPVARRYTVWVDSLTVDAFTSPTDCLHFTNQYVIVALSADPSWACQGCDGRRR